MHIQPIDHQMNFSQQIIMQVWQQRFIMPELFLVTIIAVQDSCITQGDGKLNFIRHTKNKCFLRFLIRSTHQYVTQAILASGQLYFSKNRSVFLQSLNSQLLQPFQQQLFLMTHPLPLHKQKSPNTCVQPPVKKGKAVIRNSFTLEEQLGGLIRQDGVCREEGVRSLGSVGQRGLNQHSTKKDISSGTEAAEQKKETRRGTLANVEEQEQEDLEQIIIVQEQHSERMKRRPSPKIPQKNGTIVAAQRSQNGIQGEIFEKIRKDCIVLERLSTAQLRRLKQATILSIQNKKDANIDFSHDSTMIQLIQNEIGFIIQDHEIERQASKNNWNWLATGTLLQIALLVTFNVFLGIDSWLGCLITGIIIFVVLIASLVLTFNCPLANRLMRKFKKKDDK